MRLWTMTWFALPILATFGSLLPVAGPFFAFRVAIMVLFGLSLASGRFRPAVVDPHGAIFKLLVAVWIGSGAVLSLLEPRLSASMREFLPVVLGLALIWAASRVDDTRTTLHAVLAGWVASFIITSAIAARELVAGIHLPNYLLAGSLDPQVQGLVASTLGNPNNYAAYLVGVIGFVAPWILYARRVPQRFGAAVIVVCAAYLVTQTGSLLSAASVVVQALLLTLVCGRRRRLPGAIATIGFAIAAVWFSTVPGASVNVLTSNILQGSAEASGQVRADLYLAGLWLVYESGGVGVGPGGFERVMATGRIPFDTHGVVNPHNVYLEIAAQYGVWVLILFLGWLGMQIVGSSRALQEEASPDAAWSASVILVLGGMSIAGLASSSFLIGSVNWALLATIALISADRRQKQTSDAPTTPVKAGART